MKRVVAFVSRELRTFIAVAVLIVPIAIVAPSAIGGEVTRANGSDVVYGPPYGNPLPTYNEALARGVVAHVPPHASVAVIGTNLASVEMRWVGYVIAPRQLTSEPARWTLVFGETPVTAGLFPRRAWRYGSDWLVEG